MISESANTRSAAITASAIVLVVAWSSIGSCLFAESPEVQSLKLFEQHVRPTLLDQCIRCHGPKKQQGGLRLDSKAWVMKGGDSGAVITPGNPEESLLVEAVRYTDPGLEMPPKGRLDAKTIQGIEKWVQLGAVDPRTETTVDLANDGSNPPSVEEGRSFWSFQPIRNPAVPSVVQTEWSRTAIDRFILAKLESRDLRPVEDADRRTLVRRVYYDLIGLPPTPQQIEAFVDDRDLEAYEKLIDRLLESSEFGERWGRHWLDVVRYAESSGGGRTLLFPNAWRYRDYVIDAFNADMPYNQFVTEQIAGDLIGSEDWQQRRRQLTATAFLLLGPTNYELQDKDILEMDVVDEQIDTIGKSLLGMTIGCARCHDHKFDPIPAKDYYAMAGILKSTKSMIHENVSKWNKVNLPVSPEDEIAIAKQEAATKQMAGELASLEKKFKALTKGKARSNNKPQGDRNIPSSSLSGIVIDDADAELVGKWAPSTHSPRFVDGKYIHDETVGKGGKRAIYRPVIPEAGMYEVRVGYSPGKNRSSRVPVHVHHADGESVVTIDQKQTPEVDDAFQSIGSYRFDPQQESRIVISNKGTEDGVVIADAVVLIKVDLPPLPKPAEVDIPANIAFIVQDPSRLDGIVVDDTDAKLQGEWKHSVHTPPFVGANYIHDVKEGKGVKTATFTPHLPHAGEYEVRVSHNTNVRRANNVPITIHHADGETVVHIDEGQEAPIDKLFRSLGKFRFDQGDQGSVVFSTGGTEGKYVIVDAVQFLPAPDKARAQRETKSLQAKIKTLKTRLREAKASGLNRAVAMATEDDDDAGDIHLAIRGVVHNRGDLVPRGVMQVTLPEAQAHAGRPLIAAGESGRRELAQWIVDPQNPLPARVIANRVWYWLMGRGLVRTVDNFGSTGETPTHPELLDHLASDFVDRGWSIKQLIRKIMLSRVYQLSSKLDPAGSRIDPPNDLFWRMNRKRLRAEDVRDTLLFVAGSLDQTIGGSNIKPGTKSEYGYQFKSTRRSVYVPVFRNTLPEIFEVFDFADPNIQRGSRTSSTVASQALLLMNHPFVIEQSRVAGETLWQTKRSPIDGVHHAYMQVLGRTPSEAEQRLAVDFIAESRDEKTQWSLLYQTLFECVDFRYVK